MAKIHFEGMHFRRDIGHWAVRGAAANDEGRNPNDE
jgi:phosphoribosylamine-glycine ligase